jgi:hypothetical protein
MQTKLSTIDTISRLNEEIEEYANPPKEIIYIVAGNRKEFENYANDKLKDEANKYKEYRYINNRYDLMGLDNIKGYYIGTAFQREDINQIKQAIAYVKERTNLTDADN